MAIGAAMDAAAGLGRPAGRRALEAAARFSAGGRTRTVVAGQGRAVARARAATAFAGFVVLAPAVRFGRTGVADFLVVRREG